ncbi:hypothetical protein CCR97_24180 [Rhodoplanes elegans]|uniref:Uncharacterized protein n=1 Tax=Rhodoplanes elegans TaxID=29408 RepID=A0A327KW26_9BRAD|nr:hypothetical protein [Rhodoplanes elegans]MBK5961279.1 hypothetical protein [Rhodoplanes elegans]RAI41913.1 hypothetical protein CH338_01595 [Rhodoplanes elegans]
MRDLSHDQRHRKLRTLARAAEYASVEEMLEACTEAATVPAICTEFGCSHTTRTDRDADSARCEACGRNTVASAIVLAYFA